MSKRAPNIIAKRVLAAGVLGCLVWTCFAAWPAAGADARLPNFAPDDSTGWVPARGAGDEFLPPASGPGPVSSEKSHPYVPNREGQPTYRIAEVNNPILQPWVVERLKKANDAVRAGKVPFIPMRDAGRAAFRASRSTTACDPSISCRRRRKSRSSMSSIIRSGMSI